MAQSDYIYYNARFYSFDPTSPAPVEAVAVRDGRIVGLGKLAELRAQGQTTLAEPIDLKGATVVPGLNDAHTHLLWWAKSLQKINLVGVDRLETVVERVRARAATTPAGAWLTGLGWDKNLWGTAFPTKAALDRAAPDHPVALRSKDGHLLWVNSRALAMCRVDSETPDPPGGQIERDVSGQPTGIFKENAVELVSDYLDQPDPTGDLAALEAALPVVARAGLTGVHTVEGAEGLSALQRLREKGGLSVRATVLPYSHAAQRLIELGFRQGFGDELLKLGQIKFFLDGTLGSQTAAMFEPFLTPLSHDGDACEDANRGILRLEEAEFLAQARFCVQHGFALAVHVIGDRAARLGLDVIEQVMAEAGSGALPPGARNRLEHIQLLKAADLPRLAASGIIASVQPTHATTDRDTAEAYWGLERLQTSGRGYAYKSLLQSGARLALGSDVPIEPIEPLPGIYAAVARKRPDDERPAWLPAERLSVAEAIAGFSSGAAFAAGDEGWRGVLAPGRAADFTALGQDILALGELHLLETPVVATIVAGQPVFTNL